MTYPCPTRELPVHFEHLLQFTTGADAVPPMGFPGCLNVIFYDQEEGVTRYPNASTCAMTLALPRGHEILNRLRSSYQDPCLIHVDFTKHELKCSMTLNAPYLMLKSFFLWFSYCKLVCMQCHK